MFINKKSIGTRKKQVSGRNNKGCISVYNRGGGHIKKYLFTPINHLALPLSYHPYLINENITMNKK